MSAILGLPQAYLQTKNCIWISVYFTYKMANDFNVQGKKICYSNSSLESDFCTMEISYKMF